MKYCYTNREVPYVLTSLYCEVLLTYHEMVLTIITTGQYHNYKAITNITR